VETGIIRFGFSTLKLLILPADAGKGWFIVDIQVGDWIEDWREPNRVLKGQVVKIADGRQLDYRCSIDDKVRCFCSISKIEVLKVRTWFSRLGRAIKKGLKKGEEG